MAEPTISPAKFREKLPETYGKWQRYARARAFAETKEAESKIAKQAMRIAESELLDIMLEEEVNAIPDESGANTYPSRHWDISCNQDNYIDVTKFLRDTYGDVEQFKTYVLDRHAVRAKLKDDCEDEKKNLVEDELPEFFNLNTRPKLNVRGWDKKKAEFAYDDPRFKTLEEVLEMIDG